MVWSVRARSLLAGTALAAASLVPGGARGQVVVPEVVVTTPSPVVRRPAPVRRVEAPAPTPVARPTPPRARPPVRVAARTPIPARRRAGRAAPVVAAVPPVVASPAAPSPEPSPAAGGEGSFPTGVLPVATNTFAPVTVVPQGEIAREQPRQLGDLLFDRPGVTSSSYAPNGASRPIIRGQDNFRVRIQENGVRAGDVSEVGEDHAVPINPLVNDRIEVIRGPATLRYGSQAIGGVVSAENNRVPTFIPLDPVISRFTTGVSSVDRGYNAAATVDAGGANVAVHADGFVTRTQDYRTPRGREFNSFSESQGGAFGASYFYDSGFFGLAYTHYDSIYGIPGGQQALQRTTLDPVQDKLLARGEHRFSSGPFDAVRFSLGLSNYNHRERGLDDDGVNGIRTTFKNREAEGRVELQHVPVATALGSLVGSIGLQGSVRDLSTTGEGGGLFFPTVTRNLAGYVFEELDLGGGLRLQGAARVERSEVRGTAQLFPPNFLPTFTAVPGLDAETGSPIETLIPDELGTQRTRREFTPASFGFGALQELGYGFVGSLNGQYVERAPAAPELFSRGAHDATATFEIGDPNLKLERARSVELSVRRAAGPIRLEATGYYTRYTGFIFKRLTGERCGDTFETCGEAPELAQVVYSQANATFYGAEIAGQIDLVPVRSGFIGIDGQFDFVRAQFDDGSNVPRIPPYRVGGGVFWRDGGFFARVGLLHAFAQTRFAEFETPTPGYDLLRAEVSYTRRFDPRVYTLSELTVGLAGNNLLDDEVRNSASFKKDEILLPGRNVRLFLTARF